MLMVGVAGTEHELKFLLPPSRVPVVRAFLGAACRPDPIHPSNFVFSLYYDTRRLDLLQEKIDSQRCKVKVRLRWYGESQAPDREGPSFLEVKRRTGTLRSKRRLETGVPASRLRACQLTSPDLAALPGQLPYDAFRAAARLVPYLVVRYRRDRLTDPVSGSRVSVDTEIGVDRINPQLLTQRHPSRLAMAVVEVKTHTAELPAHLRGLLDLGCRMASFSKYASCFETTMCSHPSAI